jgi:hypothetical protein
MRWKEQKPQVLKIEIMQGPRAKNQCAGYLYVELFTPPPARAVTNYAAKWIVVGLGNSTNGNPRAISRRDGSQASSAAIPKDRLIFRRAAISRCQLHAWRGVEVVEQALAAGHCDSRTSIEWT